jgi:myo-inositol 2-dehydrogenase/D-chiro-inositol 1-dehydrogenase
MRRGLTGLGRIGAFHATTLTDLEAVDSLVIYEQAGGIDGVVIAAATDVDPELILASLPPPCPCTSIA